MTDLIPPNLSGPHSQPAPPIQYQYAQTPQVLCRFCHNGPAVQTSFRQHTGMLIMMQFSSIQGPFCRDCGLYAFRKTTGHTLVAGWWGYASAVIAPITILINLVRRGKVAKLPPPVVTPGGTMPVNPGKPLLLRPVALGLLVPLAIVGFAAAVVISDQTENQVGKCVSESANRVDVEFVPCAQPHDGRITMVVDRIEQCPSGTLGAVSREVNGRNFDDGKLLCVGAP